MDSSIRKQTSSQTTTTDKAAGNVLVSRVSDIRTVKSAHGDPIMFVDASAAVSDQQVLAEIGYKEELNREYSTLQIFGIAFSIMGLLPSIASTLDGGLTSGTVGCVWGWLLSSILILTIGIALAEISSSLPTAGAVYVSCYMWAPKNCRKSLSYVVGFLDTLSLSASVCSIVYGLAEQILSAVTVSNPDFEVTNPRTYGVFAACVLSMALISSLASSFTAKLQTTSIICNCGLILLFFIAVPVGVKRSATLDYKFNDGKFIFGNTYNSSNWSYGWQFFVAGFMPALWTIGAYDSCVHQSEEAKDAVRAVPIGIIGSISVCGLLGFLLMIEICACMDPDIDSLLNSPYGQSMTQIIYDALGKRWTLAFLSFFIICQYLMGASTVVAVSRQFWAFSRDDGIPVFSEFFKKVDPKVNVPVRAVWGSTGLALALGCLCFAGDDAANALFSLSVAGMYMALIIPITLRLTYGRKDFRPGPFYLGKILSPIVNWISVAYQAFAIMLTMFPAQNQGTDKDTMNYTVVIGPGFLVISMVYYFAVQRKYYQGPKSNLSDEEYTKYVGEDVIDAIISSNIESNQDAAA
ncbi:related to GABA-specific permease [Saccharomycodes ludwigii]|uniref:Related to GABA-specific permease n=1 Tax=Saccharomycodes ludwigii TaxID=36035 RepID=A0A376BC44_9ASCO|nr:hypothetical protein SCDLUD_005299 [Saccharomycodes ludwigii]KAH3898952.1 hypothetical protein SCDLUD_005299 [Saccharomycodes ludwigii]SSD61700.1 related to GABA-specific permease [Saccharomycodes ludwigii]